MSDRVEVTAAAHRDLRKLPQDILHRIDMHIIALADHPFPPRAKKLESGEPFYRVRVGDDRIVYTVEHHRLVILIIRVRHRRDVYRGL